MAMAAKPAQDLTGWHVPAIFIAFFGVTIAVNVGLAWKAVTTFVFGDGVYIAAARLARGKWMMALSAHAADGMLFRQRIDLHVNR